MRRPIRTFLQQSAIKALLQIEKPIYELSNGKHARNRFLSSVKIPHLTTNVKIIKETDTATYIAKFNPDGTYDNSDFRILCTTDLHLDVNYDLNDRTLQNVVNHIAELKPDLIIFTGDVVLSKYQQIDCVQFAKMMDEMGIYWSYVFGNHEAREEKEYFKYLLLKSLSDSPYCLSKFGDPSLYGYGNFIINIMGGENHLKKSLVLFDSGRYVSDAHIEKYGISADKTGGADFVKPTQIEWYTKEMDSLRQKYGKAESMIYLHIPVPEYTEVFTQQEDGSFVPSGKAEIIYGSQREPCGVAKHNSGLFDAMKQNGGQAIFCGHDHCNDFCAKYEGIYLVYNLSGGYHCYHNYDHSVLEPDEKTWPYGVNVTDIHPDGSLSFFDRKHSVYLD